MVAFGAGLVNRGEWIGVLGERVAAVLPPQSAELAANLWVSLDAGESFEDALDVVLRQGLSGVPSLVLVEAEGEGRVRLLVRGAPIVRVRTARTTVVGENVTEVGSGTGTWQEQRFSDVLSLEVELGVEGEANEQFTPGLRRLGGLVLESPVGASSRPISQALPKPVIAPVVAPVEPVVEESPAEPEPVTEPEAVLDIAPSPVLSVLPEPGLDTYGGEETAPLVAAQWGDEPVEAAAPVAPVAESSSSEPADAPDVLDGLPAPVIAPVPAPAIAPVVVSSVSAEDAPAAGFVDADDIPTGATEVLSVAAVTGEQPQGDAPARTAGLPQVVFEHGDVLDLDRVYVVGRAPSPTASGSPDAATLAVPSPLGEVSANHLEVFAGVGPDSDRVVVVDLGSTNGTVVRREGHSPRQLKPRIPVLLSDGDVVDLGDGATFRVVSG
ncbi:FHA domain-containing protein [Nocardioides yefusunii]|uniref:FHA domain-containing protein n=1 Tax=Nocardioides yefusunii TaxID=2500546 RepID=A0ABW1R0Z6_9ACTN|nr:FHA domain-containing protein [Nocardioides yefusunii]